MPAPIVAGVLVIARLVTLALSIYETLDVLTDLYEGLDKYNKGVDEAKKQLEKLIKDLKGEIDSLVDQKQQVAVLKSAAAVDPQNPATQRASGRGAEDAVIKAAVQQKIPFRRIISDVCEKADSMPVIQLRKKKGVSVKDLPNAKRKALEEILRVGLENVADVDLDGLILVRLKQLAASLMFEFVDHCLDWASPLKAEVTFGPPKQYTDHPVERGTKLQRAGKVSPFYPFPKPNNRRGSISADLVINEYRKQRTDKNNIFAIVEIKFEGDKIDGKQFKQYDDLLVEAAKTKTKASPVRLNNEVVSSGGRLSLFRYPEDKARPAGADEKTQSKPPRKSKTR